MKKTVYFTSPGNYSANKLKEAITTAEMERDTWLKDMKDTIGKIEKEDIKFAIQQNYAYVIIQLSYYPK